ncbi:MAG TPA: hypothetical protein VHW96_04905 [Solirubrobacteraceae bacterium]|nr:hypothetical protein [Solirubrobacteraceae bacterium]
MSAESSFSFEEPVLGPAWIRVAGDAARPEVEVTVSLERSWDVELTISAQDATALADALGSERLAVAPGTTIDGVRAVLIAEADRLAVVVVAERLSDVLTLDEHAYELAAHLRAAAAA